MKIIPMKNKYNFQNLLSFLVWTLPLSLSSCYFDFDDADGAHGPSIVGSGNIVVEERTLSSFDQVEAHGAYSVIVRQGTQQLVEIEGDDNVLSIITTRVQGGKLDISNTRNYRTTEPIKVYITVPVLSSIEMNGSGNIFGETLLTGDLLKVEINGSGNADLEVDYIKLVAEGKGSGNFQLFGVATEQEVELSGSGNYRAKELLSENTDIKISGSGNAEVAAEKILDAKINGSGNITYFGNPDFVNTSVNGSGKLIKGE